MCDDKTIDCVNAVWLLRDNKVQLKTHLGDFVKVSSVNILKAEFTGLREIDQISIDGPPSKYLPKINFQRFPLYIRLCVAPPDINVLPTCWLEAYNSEITVNITSVNCDQLVHDKCWFPLLTFDLDAIQNALKEADIYEIGQLKLRQYLDLIRQDAKQIKVIESETINGNAVITAGQTLNLEGLLANLYNYQKFGVKWLNSIASENLGSILGDEMGLGKTVQIIAMLVSEVNATRKPSLIIAPATLLENWRRELLKFAPHLKVYIQAGQNRTGFPSKLKQYEVVITSYDTAVNDISMLKMVSWNLVVIDEAQAIKNPDALRTNTVKKLPRRVGVAVTGTPVENSLRDLWSIMDFCCPGLLGNLDQFESRYEDCVESASLLEKIVSPLILRRLLKNVVNELPERIDVNQAIDMKEHEVLEYISLRNEIKENYGEAANFVALTKLRMYCTHPFLITNGKGDPASYSNKYLRLIEILDEIMLTDSKVIVFTSFKGMIDLFMNDLRRRYNTHCSYIDGRIDVPDRQAIVDDFYDFDGSALLLLNPKAAGTGLNITAANYVIHYNLEWNPAVEDQATARAYRLGQENPVKVYRLYYSGTIEEVIDNRTIFKREMSEKAVVGTEGEENEREYLLKAIEISPSL